MLFFSVMDSAIRQLFQLHEDSEELFLVRIGQSQSDDKSQASHWSVAV